MNRRFVGLVALSIAAASLVAGCGSSSPATTPPPTKVTVVLDWTPNTNHLGLYLAKQKGYYAAAGLEVSIVEPDQNGAVAQMAAGNAEFGISAAEQLLPARAQGTKITSIASVMRTNTSSLIAPADRDIRRPRDLAGHTYGGFGGELERALVDTLVRCDGGDPSKVRYAEVGNVDYSVGFKKHHYDAVWVFDGWDTIRMRDLQKMAVTTLAFRDHLDCIPDWYTPIIVARDDVIADNPAIVRAFLTATAKGYEDMRADPAASATAVAETISGTDPELWRRSAVFLAPFLDGPTGRWGLQDPAVWTAFNTFLRTHKLETVADPSSAFTNAFVPAR